MRHSRVIALLLPLLVAAVAWGDSKTLAREAFREGARQYDLGDYSKALELFKKAYLNFEEPTILFNIAQCQRQLGDKPEAIKLYRSYVRKVPDAPNRPEVERLISRLETELAQEKATKTVPPEGTLTPIEHVTATPPAPAAKQPLYKKWWLWTVVGAVVAVGVGVGLGVGLSSGSTHLDPTLGNLGPGMKNSSLVSW